MTAPVYEVNFDGIVGPTHNYAGLARGNLAAQAHAHELSNPREAALQGLAKMKALFDLGLKQAVLPPHERPYLPALRRLGFAGPPGDILAAAWEQEPGILLACASAAAMWTANAATVSPSMDTGDGRVHLTPANLVTNFHRAIEAETTSRILCRIFADPARFTVHPPLAPVAHLGDEGAANHTRLCADYGAPGVELFVYGRVAFDAQAPAPEKYPARQTREASAAIARLHKLEPVRTVFAQQNPKAIDAGVFHNDVIAVGNRNVLLYHQDAFVDEQRVLGELNEKFDGELVAVRISRNEVPLGDAVKSYLFNSQLVSLADGTMVLIAPSETAEVESVRSCIDRLLAGNAPIAQAHRFDLRQSMNNGGGPACLRLRVVLSEDELAAVHPGVLFDAALYERLTAWVTRHYRDRLSLADLADPALYTESCTALDELTEILGLGSLYDFQTE